jgi:hypothetical protein
MALKLIMVGRLSYYFCGRIALSINNTKENPVVKEIDELTDKEVVGLLRAIKTGVIAAIEGADELLERGKVLEEVKRKKVDTVEVEIKEIKTEEDSVEETKEEEKTSEKEDIKEEEKSEVIEEVVKEEVVKKVATPKRTTTKKVTK